MHTKMQRKKEKNLTREVLQPIKNYSKPYDVHFYINLTLAMF